MMSKLKKLLGVGKPTDPLEQRLFDSAQEERHNLRERLERLERADLVIRRQDIKRHTE